DAGHFQTLLAQGRRSKEISPAGSGRNHSRTGAGPGENRDTQMGAACCRRIDGRTSKENIAGPGKSASALGAGRIVSKVTRRPIEAANSHSFVLKHPPGQPISTARGFDVWR